MMGCFGVTFGCPSLARATPNRNRHQARRLSDAMGWMGIPARVPARITSGPEYAPAPREKDRIGNRHDVYR